MQGYERFPPSRRSHMLLIGHSVANRIERIHRLKEVRHNNQNDSHKEYNGQLV